MNKQPLLEAWRDQVLPNYLSVIKQEGSITRIDRIVADVSKCFERIKDDHMEPESARELEQLCYDYVGRFMAKRDDLVANPVPKLSYHY